MSHVKILSARDPAYTSPNLDTITLWIKFSHLPEEEVPFTAYRHDSEEHGREAFSRAVGGEWGPVAPYTGPSKKDMEADRVRAVRDRKLLDSDPLVARALEDDDQDRLEEVRRYRKALRDVPLQKDFPWTVEWPELPT